MATVDPPVLIAQGIGYLTRSFLREVGSLFWFIVNTFEETFERIQRGRVPFRAASFFRHTQCAGVDSVPLVGLVSFFQDSPWRCSLATSCNALEQSG